jgi:iron(III) transport system substrate-binding protein
MKSLWGRLLLNRGIVLRSILLIALGASGALAASAPSGQAGKTESLDALYEKAKREGGQLTLYIALSARSEEVIVPLFKKRFPAIQINHVDATSDKLVARIVAEARGGRTIGDVFGGTPGYLAQLNEQKLLASLSVPEASAYPVILKGAEWVATDTQFFIAGWNTAQIKKGEEPKQFEDFADPRWKGRLIAEPRDFQLLMGLAKRKNTRATKKRRSCLKGSQRTGLSFTKAIHSSPSCWWRARRRFASPAIRTTFRPE